MISDFQEKLKINYSDTTGVGGATGFGEQGFSIQDTIGSLTK